VLHIHVNIQGAGTLLHIHDALRISSDVSTAELVLGTKPGLSA
jgi:hypothetical protein